VWPDGPPHVLESVVVSVSFPDRLTVEEQQRRGSDACPENDGTSNLIDEFQIQMVASVGDGRPQTPLKSLMTLVLQGYFCGCGGPQQIVPAALLGGSVNVKTLAFLTEVPDVRLSLG